MKLREIEFGPVTGASGVQGWYGEGYRFHKWWGPFGPDFTGMTFVAKTTTLHERLGNTELTGPATGWRPKRLVPKSIKVYPFRGMVVNSVGLSGPGASALFATHEWDKLDKPFMLSFMSVAATREQRMDELKGYCEILNDYLVLKQLAPVALQINLSCPNVGLDLLKLTKEGVEALDIASQLDIPLLLKLNTLFPATGLEELEHPALDAICISNTLPWSTLYKTESPLAHLGGGGVSGAPIFKHVRQWVNDARASGCKLPFNVGGGIMSQRDVSALVLDGLDLNRDSIFLGSVAILRPWRVRGIIRYARGLAQDGVDA